MGSRSRSSVARRSQHYENATFDSAPKAPERRGMKGRNRPGTEPRQPTERKQKPAKLEQPFQPQTVQPSRRRARSERK